jgi:Holliday junction resolvase RusA-like endonuclease
MSLLDQPRYVYRVNAFGAQFTVLGKPQPGGSKRAYPVKNKTTGKTRCQIVDDNEDAVKPWRNQVEIVASELMGDRPPFVGPLMLVVDFYFERPKGHYGVHGVRRSAPKFPSVRPDTTKLLRPLEDALSGILWKDDALIVEQIARKRYGSPPRAEVKVAVMVA